MIRFAAFGCVHEPVSDPEAKDWLIEQLRSHRPQVVVHLGDGIEASAASRWADSEEVPWDLSDEFKSHNDFLKRVRLATPKAKHVFIPGNHENGLRKAGRLSPKIRKQCDWEGNQPEIADGRWLVGAEYRMCRIRGVWRLGQVVFGHGWATSDGAIKKEAFYLTDPHGLYVAAHTHRPHDVQPVTWGDLKLRCHYVNAGCLRDLDPDYMGSCKKYNWGHGIVIGEADPVKSPRASAYWRAELVLKERYDAWAERRFRKAA